jgi:16S rRNA G966 N2-methylase RsmD
MSSPSPLTPTTTDAKGAGIASVLSIIVDERLRSDDAEIRIKIENELAPSIAEYGVLQPILLEELPEAVDGVNVNGEPIASCIRLVAGWSRLSACALLKREDIPYNTREAMPDYLRLELELEENLRRNDMSWQDIALSIDKIHSKRKLLALQEGGPTWGLRQTGYLMKVSFGSVQNALTMASYLKANDPEIVAAPTMTAAQSILLKRKEDKASAILAERQSAFTKTAKGIIKEVHEAKEAKISKPAIALPGGSSASRSIPDPKAQPAEKVTTFHISSMIYNLDSILPQEDGSPSFMSRLETESIDLIYTDPPFGIDMDDLEGRADIDRIREAHGVSENLNQMRLMFRHAYRVLKEKSYFLFWLDLSHWEKIVGGHAYTPHPEDDPSGRIYKGEWNEVPGWLQAEGFTVCRWPIVWHKTHTCRNRAPHCWPTKSIEYLCVARKDTATLIKPMQDCVFSCSGAAERKKQLHPFSKPYEFTQWLGDYFVRPGMVVLDPYAGEGSMVRALLNLKCNVLACEKNEKHFNHLSEHVKKHFTNITPGKVEFV